MALSQFKKRVSGEFDYRDEGTTMNRVGDLLRAQQLPGVSMRLQP